MAGEAVAASMDLELWRSAMWFPGRKASPFMFPTPSPFLLHHLNQGLASVKFIHMMTHKSNKNIYI
jgi:hypothetical protein